MNVVELRPDRNAGRASGSGAVRASTGFRWDARGLRGRSRTRRSSSPRRSRRTSAARVSFSTAARQPRAVPDVAERAPFTTITSRAGSTRAAGRRSPSLQVRLSILSAATEDKDGSTIDDSPRRDPRLRLCAHSRRHRRVGDRRRGRDRARHRAAFVLRNAEPRDRPRPCLDRDRRPERRRQARSRDREPSRQQRLGLPQPRRRLLPGSTRLRHLCRTDVASGRRRERRPERRTS